MIVFNKKLKKRIAELEKKQKEDSDLLNQQRLKIEMLQRQILNPSVFKVGDEVIGYVVLSFDYRINTSTLSNIIAKFFISFFTPNSVKANDKSKSDLYTYFYKLKNKTTNTEINIDQDTLIELKKAISKK